MSSLATVLNLIKENLYTEKKDSAALDFFYSSMLHYAISIEIASSNHAIRPATFELICSIIPKKYGCRSSIKTVLDHGVYKGFFIKSVNSKDKRVKSYILSEEFSLMITDWYLDRKKSYAS